MTASELNSTFNKQLRALLNKLESKSRSEVEIANIDRLKKRISLLSSTLGEFALIRQTIPFFIEYGDQIVSRDENFFLNMDVRGELVKRGETITTQNEFVFGLVDSIRNHYTNSKQNEKDVVYEHLKKMFQSAIEFELL